MPRTVEHIVACHEAASTLRASGKPIWSRIIDIKTVLHEDQSNASPEHVTSVANRIGKLLRAKVPASMLDQSSDDCDFDFLDTVELMEECTAASLASDLENGCEAVEMLNGWLETLYDWADTNRVWLGN